MRIKDPRNEKINVFCQAIYKIDALCNDCCMMLQANDTWGVKLLNSLFMIKVSCLCSLF